MERQNPPDVTQILQAVSDGQESASERLLPLVYEELRRLARARLAGEPPGHTLQATALVHEAYLRLLGEQDVLWDNRAHFFGAAARAMRRILVDRARRQQRLKRGGGRRQVSLEEAQLGAAAAEEDLLTLDEALTRLQDLDPRKHQIVMLRYFAGLTIDETARSLDVSPATVKKNWSFTKAWLLAEIAKGDEDR